MNSYNLKDIRIGLINMLVSSLNKNSKFYNEDKENIIKGVNSKNRKELIEAYNRQVAIMATSDDEIKRHCIV